MSSVSALRVQLAAVEEAIWKNYQDRHKQDPASRPRPDVGTLGRLWSHFEYLAWELEQLGEVP